MAWPQPKAVDPHYSNMDDAETTTSDTAPGPVAVPRQVHCELTTLRQLNGVDLLSPDVLDVLAAYDFEATREWAVSHPNRYVRAVELGTQDASLVPDSTAGD